MLRTALPAGRSGTPPSGQLRVLRFAIGVVAIIILLYLVPKVQMLGINGATDLERVGLENELRTTLVQAVAGLLVLVGAFRAWQEYQLDRQKQRAEREAQSAEQFASSIGLLSDEDVLLRLSALQRLDIVADGSDIYRDRVIDILVAFLRKHRLLESYPATVIPRQTGRGGQAILAPVIIVAAPMLLTGIKSFPRDCQVALDIIGRQRGRSQTYAQRLNFTHLNLERASFRGGCFRDADFSQSALACADFTSSDLEGASLTALTPGGLGSTEACFADFSFANLQNADLSRARFLGATFLQTQFKGAELSGARMHHAKDVEPDQLKEGKNFEFSIENLDKDEPEQD